MELEETDDNDNEGVNKTWENTAIAARHVCITGSKGQRNGCHLMPGRQLIADKG